jgi:hypothetical protein
MLWAASRGHAPDTTRSVHTFQRMTLCRGRGEAHSPLGIWAERLRAGKREVSMACEDVEKRSSFGIRTRNQPSISGVARTLEKGSAETVPQSSSGIGCTR